jgi:hypothetical protein
MKLRTVLPGAAREHHRTGFELLTLDVFDTCLIRDFVSQESLWYLLGQEITNQFSCVPNAAEFVRLRGSAEDEARSRGTGEDIALVDVYARIGANLGWNPEQQRQAVALEEDLEMRSLRLNPRADALLAKASGSSISPTPRTVEPSSGIASTSTRCRREMSSVREIRGSGREPGLFSAKRAGDLTLVATGCCISVMTSGATPPEVPGPACRSQRSLKPTQPGMS